MAIQNYIDVLALVRAVPLVKKGELTSRVTCELGTIHGSLDQEDSHSSTIFLSISEEQRMIAEMSKWEKYDIVRITGFIATKDTHKKVVCPHCNEINLRSEAISTARSGGSIVSVFPIYARKIESFKDYNSALQFLYDNESITNNVILLGNLTKDPEYQKNCARYQLGINRKYCPKGASDIKNERADYPWIYSYGNNAFIDYAGLKKGSVVYVRGFIQSRSYMEEYKCVDCGESFSIKGRTLEVRSAANDYLLNCDFDAIEEAKNKIKEQQS